MNPDMDDNVKAQMAETIAKLAETQKGNVDKGAKTVGDNLFKKGMLMRDAIGVGPDKAEQIYAQAYQMYKTGKFRDAQKIFSSLITLNPFEYKYLFGLASATHMLEEYETASKLYMQSTMLEKDNPLPYFHASDCYLHIHQEFSAIVALQMCINLCADRPEYSIVKEKAEMTLASHPVEKLNLSVSEEDMKMMKSVTNPEDKSKSQEVKKK